MVGGPIGGTPSVWVRLLKRRCYQTVCRRLPRQCELRRTGGRVRMRRAGPRHRGGDDRHRNDDRPQHHCRRGNHVDSADLCAADLRSDPPTRYRSVVNCRCCHIRAPGSPTAWWPTSTNFTSVTFGYRGHICNTNGSLFGTYAFRGACLQVPDGNLGSFPAGREGRLNDIRRSERCEPGNRRRASGASGPSPFQRITHMGACGKAPVMPHNRWSRPDRRNLGRRGNSRLRRRTAVRARLRG